MDESLIDAFIISTPSIFEKKDYVEIDIALDYKIELVELYPVYSDELPLYRQIGTQKFISRLGNEVFNLNRKPIVI